MSMRLWVCALAIGIAFSAAAEERAIWRGERLEETIELPADQFVTLKIEQFDIDLETKVLDPAGAEVVRGAAEYLPRLSFVTRSAGTYRVALESIPQSSRSGTVDVQVIESRPAQSEDRMRIDAQSAHLQGALLLRERTAAAGLEARPLLERALALWRGAGDCDGEAWALFALAGAYGVAQDWPSTVHYFQEALALQRSRRDARGMFGSLRGIGQVIWRSDPARARPLFEEAVTIAQALSFATAEADVRNHLGLLDGAAGEHRAAIAHYEEALAISSRAGNPFQEALFTQNIAVSLASLGEWRRALTYFDRAVPIYRSIGEKHELANTLTNVGAAYTWLGEHRDALAQYRLALPILRETGNRRLEASVHLNRGIAHLELGERAKARAALDEALSMARALDELRLEANVLRHMARLEAKGRRTKRALELHEQSLVIQRAAGNRRGEAFALLSVGNMRRELGEHGPAMRAIAEAHALSCELEDPSLDSASRLALAYVHAGNGRLHAAWRELDAALLGVESLRVNVAGQHLRASYQVTLREYYELAVDVLMRMNEPALALQTAERARARGLLDSLAEAQVDVRQGGHPDLLAKEKKLRRTINDKAALLARAAKKSLSGEIDALVAELRQTEARIRASSPRYASLTQPAPLTLREIQRRVLDDDTLLLEISLGEKRGYAWLVTNDSLHVRRLPGRRQVEAVARRFHEALTERNRVVKDETPQARRARLARAREQAKKDGARLYAWLFRNVPDKQRLLVVADGALQYVPFAAIPAPDGLPLVTRFEVVHMPSVSALEALRRETRGRRKAEATVAVLADPVFDDPRMPRLPLTRDEAASIARVAPRAVVRTGYEATRAVATSGELRRFRYVHFATHGVVDDRNPELSGIVLSLVDEQGRAQDGYLRLHDIYNLDLPADLVVLSACQTALGKEVAAEGLVGLTRGFMYAGAERVLASLWKIDDRATAELMGRFYERMLVGGMAPAAALRAVQIEMARSARWSEPYHWAAFVLQGEWRP